MPSNIATRPIIYIAIELSASSWLVAWQRPMNKKVRLQRMDAGDTKTLLAVISEARSSAATGSGFEAEIVSCFEAGRDGFWLHRFLVAHGVANYVVEPTSILVSRGARRAKTDRLDAQGLLRVLAATYTGDHDACRVVNVPTVDEEDAKRPHREREHLVQERIRVENRIEALLATQGISKRPSLRSWERDIDGMRTGDGRPLPPCLKAELNRLRRRLTMTLELIREVEGERQQDLDTKKDAGSQTVKTLCRLRGIGDNFAAVLTREVFYRTFENRRQIASYLGLAPTPFQSGGIDRDRHINRAGNGRARKTLIQLAWLWLRYQPDSGLSKWFRERVGALEGRTRRIAIVAMARKLLIAIWRFATLGVVPAGAVIAA